MTMHILKSGSDHYKPRLSNGSLVGLISTMSYRYAGGPRRSSSITPPPVRLSIVKLDGSSFGVEVSDMGTVGEVKHAVEAAFSYLPKEGPDKVSWELVWGQFCLCHEGEMLVNDRDYISMLGIKDGHQLEFTHRASSTNNFFRRKSKGANASENDEHQK